MKKDIYDKAMNTQNRIKQKQKEILVAIFFSVLCCSCTTYNLIVIMPETEPEPIKYEKLNFRTQKYSNPYDKLFQEASKRAMFRADSILKNTN